MYITRVAPSPTGYCHIALIRVAYFNWLAARASGGRFFFRLDDTDINRNDDAYTKIIFDAFQWIGLDWDYFQRQSDRTDIYKDYANQLVSVGAAHVVDGGAIALHLPDNMPKHWTDDIAGNISITNKDLDVIKDLILIKSDGMATYNYASILDDILMGVNFIIRGADHISNTSKQIAILTALKNHNIVNVQDFKFAHAGLIMIKDSDTGKPRKMSKRDNSSNFMSYVDAGYDPDAILNFVLKLGWNVSDATIDKTMPLIDRKNATDMFLTKGKMLSAPSLFDPKKLDWFNTQYKNLKNINIKVVNDNLLIINNLSRFFKFYFVMDDAALFTTIINTKTNTDLKPYLYANNFNLSYNNDRDALFIKNDSADLIMNLKKILDDMNNGIDSLPS